jgi:hypothetical protein
MLITDLIAYLSTHSALVPLVSDRVMGIPAPPDLDQYPCITVQSPSHVPQYTGDGDAGIPDTRIVFDCLATKNGQPAYLAARQIAETLAGVLSGFTGDMGLTRIEECIVVNVLDRWDDGSKVSCTSVHVLITTN